MNQTTASYEVEGVEGGKTRGTALPGVETIVVDTGTNCSKMCECHRPSGVADVDPTATTGFAIVALLVVSDVVAWIGTIDCASGSNVFGTI